jgi:uncharacterized Tic20 family protein
MIQPDDQITVPKRTKDKSTGFQRTLTLFAVVGVIGLGMCGTTIAGSRAGNTALIGFLLIIASLVGLVITAVCMAIASVLKATNKATKQ